jgi:hypothetical protein
VSPTIKESPGAVTATDTAVGGGGGGVVTEDEPPPPHPLRKVRFRKITTKQLARNALEYDATTSDKTEAGSEVTPKVLLMKPKTETARPAAVRHKFTTLLFPRPPAPGVIIPMAVGSWQWVHE